MNFMDIEQVKPLIKRNKICAMKGKKNRVIKQKK